MVFSIIFCNFVAWKGEGRKSSECHRSNPNYSPFKTFKVMNKTVKTILQVISYKESRAAISEYFGYLGIKIDPEANSKRGEDIMISTPDSKVKVFVIPTNEELVIARDTRDIVG